MYRDVYHDLINILSTRQVMDIYRHSSKNTIGSPRRRDQTQTSFSWWWGVLSCSSRCLRSRRSSRTTVHSDTVKEGPYQHIAYDSMILLIGYVRGNRRALKGERGQTRKPKTALPPIGLQGSYSKKYTNSSHLDKFSNKEGFVFALTFYFELKLDIQ